MSFPFYLPLGPLRLHPHFVFETLAYFVLGMLEGWINNTLSGITGLPDHETADRHCGP